MGKIVIAEIHGESEVAAAINDLEANEILKARQIEVTRRARKGRHAAAGRFLADKDWVVDVTAPILNTTAHQVRAIKWLTTRVGDLKAKYEEPVNSDRAQQVTELLAAVEDLCEKRGLEKKLAPPPEPIKTQGQLLAHLAYIAETVGTLEAAHFAIPPLEREVQHFRQAIGKVAPFDLADERYVGKHGHYDSDNRKSSWKVREVNRYLTERERRWARWGVAVAFILGVIAIFVAAMAIPTESRKSLFCKLTDPMSWNWCIADTK